MSGLVEKLEAASGPNIALEAEIFWTCERDRATAAFWRGAMGLPRPLPDEFERLPRGLGMASMEAASPNYTASVDAALGLAERLFPGQEYEITTLYGVARVALNLNHGEDGGPFYGENVCGSVPLAVCAAAVKARALNLNETRHAE